MPAMPPDHDLRRLIEFSAADGTITLDGQRMLLLHAQALGSLRRELMHTIGRDQTRRLLMRAGFEAGKHDAALARKIRAHAPLHEAFAVGPQLHMLEGAAQVTPERLELDPASGRYHGVFRWDRSWEVETHLRDFGLQPEPVCWMLLGYASGYTSAFMGRLILYKEIQCQGCGAVHCRIEGRPADEWSDGAAMAHDYDPDSMLVRLERLQSQVDVLQSNLQAFDSEGPLVGRSPAFNDAVALLGKAAGTQVTVLLTGETGVGKERFARALHAMSRRAARPFVAINCAALPAELIEAELFGHERGAYTGAAAARPGRFERADGGTLFLDELGELPLAAQAKLLRVLQDGVVERLGGTHARKVDVRVVCATNVDLSDAVARGRFRQDLLYRLNVYPIRVPALRERSDDIEALAQHALARSCRRHGRDVTGFSRDALDAMRRYPWPGNVRELENLVERAVILASPGELIHAEHILSRDTAAIAPPPRPVGDISTPQPPLAEPVRPLDATVLAAQALDEGIALQAVERAMLHEAVRRCAGNVAAAARQLGLTRPQLSYRLKQDEGLAE